jgi:hypothetical protein
MRNRHGKSLLGTWSSFGKDKTGRIEKNTAHKIIISSKPRKRRRAEPKRNPENKLNKKLVFKKENLSFGCMLSLQAQSFAQRWLWRFCTCDRSSNGTQLLASIAHEGSDEDGRSAGATQEEEKSNNKVYIIIIVNATAVIVVVFYGGSFPFSLLSSSSSSSASGFLFSGSPPSIFHIFFAFFLGSSEGGGFGFVMVWFM